MWQDCGKPKIWVFDIVERLSPGSTSRGEYSLLTRGASRKQLRFPHFLHEGLGRIPDMSRRSSPVDPPTYLIMQAIGEGLRQQYEVPEEMSRELFVLLMQMNARNGPARGEQSNDVCQIDEPAAKSGSDGGSKMEGPDRTSYEAKQSSRGL